MADDSWDIEDMKEFHPCDIPHGMKDYTLQDLTPEQQELLNEEKRKRVRADQKYMAAHPEIRGIIVMILRLLMRKRPKYNIAEMIGRYFTKCSADIREEIFKYIENRKQIVAANSTERVLQEGSSVSYSASSYSSVTCKESQKEEEELELFEGVVFKLQSMIDDEDVQKYGKDLWKTESEKICAEILEKIVENAIIESEQIHSLDSIASVNFPIEFDDYDAAVLQKSISDEYSVDWK